MSEPTTQQNCKRKPDCGAARGSDVKTDNYVLSRQIMDGLVTIRKVSDDGSVVENLSDDEVRRLITVMRDSAMRVYQPNDQAHL